MKLLVSSLIALALPCQIHADSVLTKDVMEQSLVAVKLSALAYENATDYAVYDDATGNITGYQHEDYPEIHFYTEEPDQAIVARTVDGLCFVAFRGTTLTLTDWEQNIDLRDVNLYKDNNNETMEFCQGRAGYSDFIRTNVVAQAQLDMLNCTARCADPQNCLYITGHSQGGASAAQLSILTYSQLPTVITFGMPPALDEGCDLVPGRFYRFVNFRQEDEEDDDIGFDPVPFSPTFISNSVHYGHYLLVGPDDSAAKYLGFNQNYTFTPDFSDRQNEIAAHTLSGAEWSYEARISGLVNKTNQTFPVSTDGFSNGVICEPQYNELCQSGSCQANVCAKKVAELCVKASCEADEDCESGKCIWDACATAKGEVEGGCPCGVNADCASGACDTQLTSLDWVCEFGSSTSGSSFGRRAFYCGGILHSMIVVTMLVIGML